MSENDPLEITPVEVPLTQQGADSGDAPRYWYQNRSTVIALAVAILLALVVIFVLPLFVAPVSQTPVEVSVSDSTPVTGTDESPWQEAQLAKARREAQDILNSLLEKQQFLEKKSVSQWAEQEFNAAQEVARLGDVAYRKREFAEAISRYLAAHRQLTSLEQSIPDRLRKALAAGEQALVEGNQALAAAQFERALLFDSSNQKARKGLARSATLLEVNTLVQSARQQAQDGDFESAVDLYQQALSLDSESLSAHQGLAAASQQLAQQQFQAAMSEGYRALDGGEYSRAIKAFSNALAINPNDEAANNALEQARNSQSRVWLNNKLKQGAEQESQERWADAVSSYQSILERDNSIIDARIGKIRSEARLNLDQQLQGFINEPQRLSTMAVYTQARKVLLDARGVSSPGPRLKAQIAELDQLVNAAATPVAVQLVSDNKTEVEVYRVENLGRFSSRTLNLKPGRYVAVGMRKGYRSVRVEFEVSSEQSVEPVEIICREPV